MDVCPVCSESFAEPTVTGLCPTCDAAERMGARKPMLAITALIVGAIPFVFSMSNTRSTTFSRNGQIVAETVTGMDYVALGAGVLAVAMGIAAVVPSIKRNDGKGAGLGGLAVVLGVYQVLRGLYLV